MSIDLDQDAIEVDETGRQGFLARIDPTKARTSTKIEALYVLVSGHVASTARQTDRP